MLNKTRKFGIVLPALLILLAMVPAYAASLYSVTCSFLIGETPVSGVALQIYRVAESDFRWTGEYTGYSLSVDWDDNASVSSAAGVLWDYINRDGLAPEAAGSTDGTGQVVLPGLSEGIYLLCGPSFNRDGYTYCPVPVLFSVPLEDSYVQVKYEREQHQVPPVVDDDGDPVSIHVLKVWDDDDFEGRPRSVTVQLLRNGRVYDTQELSRSNNWRYTWTNLPDRGRWSVVEAEVSDEYEVSYEVTGETTVVTNSREEEVSENPPTPLPPDDGTPVTPDPPIPPTDPTTPVPGGDPPPTDDSTTTPAIPQTGLLWWPVAVLAGSGIVMLVGCILIGRKRKPVQYSFLAGGFALIVFAAAWTGANIREDQLAGQASANVLQELAQANIAEDSVTPTDQPTDYALAPEMEMPAVEIDGQRYIGTLSIPSLDIKLPILEEYSTAGLQTALCLYVGSIYSEDAIIAGHNYRSHFGPLSRIKKGETVSFFDIDGNKFVYEVTGIETVHGTDMEALEAGEWDLTLFTCTLDSQSRVVVRCSLSET